MFLLYESENKVAKNAKKIINSYTRSNREKKKKMFELFHLLVFLELSNFKNNKIVPNEPGDFIIKNNNEKYMVEITTVFGNKDENIKLNNMLNSIFDFENSNKNDDEIKFINSSMRNLFLKKLKDKQEKNYRDGLNIDKSFLLIVTGEYDNCSITGSWVLKFLQENELIFKKTFDKIWILDYFASGKDGGPIVMNDFYSEFIEYKKIILDDKIIKNNNKDL